MNKQFKLFIVVIVCIFLCSCSVKNETNMSVTRDGKFSYTVLIGIDKQLLAGLKNNQVLDENDSINIMEYVSANIKDVYLKGFKKENYNDTEYIGNKYTYEYDNIDNISSDKDIVIDLNEDIYEEKIFSKKDNIYSANFIYNLTDKEEYNEVNFINTFSVNLPSGTVSNNADKVTNGGRTLIWKIKNGEKKSIKFSFKLNNDRAYLVIASLIFDIDIILAFIILRKKVMFHG